MIGTFSGKLSEIPGLAAFLHGSVVHLRSAKQIQGDGVQAIAGWGQRPSTRRPRALAAKLGLPFIALEDGFLRSYGTGATHPTLSLVVDSAGIYYDATHPSALESLLASDADMFSGPGADHARARELILQKRLSKYNFAPDVATLPDPDATRPRILVVDQTRGDASIRYGLASASSFADMLAAARREHPGACIYVKTHPEVSNGAKHGHYTDLQADAHTILLRDAVNPHALLAHMDRVYVVTSHMGFEALLAGVPVTCFGIPWYAGWGATDDRVHCPRRNKKRSVEELFAAAYLQYTRYLNPQTHELGTIFDVIDWLAHQRRMASRLTGRCIAILSCIAACDEVHTMTSLTGFDALLREKSVTVYGRPFYAGWGLTEDRLTMPRRDRTLSLDELIAGTLLHYPLYWDWALQGFTTCEAAIMAIVRRRNALLAGNERGAVRLPYLQRQWHKLKLWARAGFVVKG